MENHRLPHSHVHCPPVSPRPSELPARALRRAYFSALFFLFRAAVPASDLDLLDPVRARPNGPRSEASKAAQNKKKHAKKAAKNMARREKRAGSSEGRGGPGGGRGRDYVRADVIFPQSLLSCH